VRQVLHLCRLLTLFTDREWFRGLGHLWETRRSFGERFVVLSLAPFDD
jgi:hypothetical protein